MIAVGLMSGTSLDGIDAARLRIVPRERGYAVDLLRFETFAFHSELQAMLHASLPPNAGTLAGAAALNRSLGAAFGDAVRAIAGHDPIDYVASHGQTLWHDGRGCLTLQAGDAFVIRDVAQATVCFDFRSADCAAGGQGAPLVPYVDDLLFRTGAERRVALNLGGVANVSLLPCIATEPLIAFDTGPGNMLLDAFVRERTKGQRTMDREGALAAAGKVEPELLHAMLADEYFTLQPPKTTGRERFGRHFLDRYTGLSALSLEDGAATLSELTAASVAAAVRRAGYGHARVIVSGGGARNPHLLARVAARLSGACVETSDAMGIPAEAKEAVAFAVLGYETLRGRPANVPHATGANRAVVLGAIAPFRLGELLDAVERECRLP